MEVNATAANLELTWQYPLSGQTSESCLCKPNSPFTRGLYGSPVWLHHSLSTSCNTLCMYDKLLASTSLYTCTCTWPHSLTMQLFVQSWQLLWLLGHGLGFILKTMTQLCMHKQSSRSVMEGAYVPEAVNSAAYDLQGYDLQALSCLTSNLSCVVQTHSTRVSFL